MNDDAERERMLRERTDDGEIISHDEYVKRSRRSFLAFGALGIGGYLGFRTIQNRPEDGSIPDVIRSGLNFNEEVWEAVQRDGASARTFSVDDIEDLRVNGTIGLGDEIAADAAEIWEIDMIGVGDTDLGTQPLPEIKDLAVQRIVWEHKCIEGWSNIVQWTGIRFSDFVEQFAPDQDDWNYVALRTPDDEYYVGLDRYTMMQEQTLLAWQLNGEDLTSDHGGPIRLVTPFKYGIKQLKRIATIEFTRDQPEDYWVERGYDFHSGF